MLPHTQQAVADFLPHAQQPASTLVSHAHQAAATLLSQTKGAAQSLPPPPAAAPSPPAAAPSPPAASTPCLKRSVEKPTSQATSLLSAASVASLRADRPSPHASDDFELSQGALEAIDDMFAMCTPEDDDLQAVALAEAAEKEQLEEEATVRAVADAEAAADAKAEAQAQEQEQAEARCAPPTGSSAQGKQGSCAGCGYAALTLGHTVRRARVG